MERLVTDKPRGVPQVDDRHVLNGIFRVLRSGAPWRDLPERYGPRTTCDNRFARWRNAGVCDRLMDATTAACGGDIEMIDSISIRAYQQAATKKGVGEISVPVAPGPAVPDGRPGARRTGRDRAARSSRTAHRRPGRQSL